MPDVGDPVTATLTVAPFSGVTAAAVTVYKPDGSTATASTPASTDGGATWTATYTVDGAGWWLEKWIVTGTGAGIEYNRVFVPVVPTSGAAPAYAGLDALKKRLRIEDSNDDDELTDALDSASRDIDRDTGRRFYLDAAVSTRVYDITHETLLLVDDIATATGLIVQTGDGISWTTVASSAYRLTPQNSLAEGGAAYAIQRVNSYWPFGPTLGWHGAWQAQVTARWGWPSIPSPIRQACLLRSQRLFRRKDSPEGVAGFNDLGVVRLARRDWDYEALIFPYVKDSP